MTFRAQQARAQTSPPSREAGLVSPPSSEICRVNGGTPNRSSATRPRVGQSLTELDKRNPVQPGCSAQSGAVMSCVSAGRYPLALSGLDDADVGCLKQAQTEYRTVTQQFDRLRTPERGGRGHYITS